jgi:hypothetical protein
MRNTKYSWALFIFIIISIFSYGQNKLLDSIPATKEGFLRTEKNWIATIDWLENTPVGSSPQDYRRQAHLARDWMGRRSRFFREENEYGNPKVVTFGYDITLGVFFLFGWKRYSLVTNNPTDTLKACLAGIELAIKYYKQGIIMGTADAPLKKDEEMEKLIILQDKKQLENWIKERI